MTRNKKYAVTGGIGSGKSTLCAILAELGYPVLSCDDISRELWGEEGYRKKLARLFPSCVNGGEIDKDALSRLVFSDGAARRTLDDFSHPVIMRRLCERASAFSVCFCEVPLLFEGGYESLFDGVIALVRDDRLRVGCICARDGITEEAARQRIGAQLPPESLARKNCRILENNGSPALLKEELLRLLEEMGISPAR